MHKTISAALLALAIAAGPVLFAGTASAATPMDTVPAASCVSYPLKYVNGKWTLVPATRSGCTTSSTGTSGSSGGSGTSTQGTATNNCNTGCTGSATGTAGRTR